MGKQGLGENATSPRRVNTALRRAKALQMRAAGAKYDDITRELGYSRRSSAVIDVQRALVAAVSEPAAEVRALELLRLDEMWVAALSVLKRAHVTVSNGRVVRVKKSDGTEEPLLDDGPVLAAIDRLLKIQERRARLLGLDAPTKVEVISDDTVDREIKRLTEELDRTAADEAAAVEEPAG